MSLSRKVAFVTGRASGIRLAIARRYAHEDVSVAIADLPGSAGEKRAAAICAESRTKAIFLPFDTSDEAQVEAAIAET